MKRLDSSVRDLLDSLASSSPTPGGGSAAALAGAAGVSLLVMVAGLAKTRTGVPMESAGLTAAAGRLRPLREILAALVDRDADAYDEVVRALSLPAGDEAQSVLRRRALDEALRAATDTPIDTMRACRQALHEALVVAAHGARSARADIGVAIELLRAAASGAGMNVSANLASLKDPAYVKRIGTERERLEAGIAADAERGLALLADGSASA